MSSNFLRPCLLKFFLVKHAIAALTLTAYRAAVTRIVAPVGVDTHLTALSHRVGWTHTLSSVRVADVAWLVTGVTC